MGSYKIIKGNDSIVIKEADKGRVVVVMNKTHCYNIILKILQNEETYKKPMKISKTLKNLLPDSAIVY